MSLSEMRSKGDEAVEQFLKDAGIDENCPIDPSSRLTLRELLLNTPKSGKSDENEDTRPTTSKENEDVEQQAPPLLQVNTSNNVLQRHVSELSDFAATTSSSAALSPQRQQHASTASTAGSFLEESKEDTLLRLLQQQTSMIVDLHQRMEELTQTVLQHQQQQQQYMPASASTTQPHPQQQQGLAAAVAPPPIAPRHHIPPAPLAAAEQPHQQPNVWMERWQRLQKIVHLFLLLRRRNVPNLDGGLIFKVAIMLAIFLSRINRRRKRDAASSGSSSQNAAVEAVWDYRFYALIVIVVGGFLVQTGFIKFLYMFFVKENYAGRIWDGEDIDPDEEAMFFLRPRQRPQQPDAVDPMIEQRHPRLNARGRRHEQVPAAAPQQQEQAGLNWRDTFLAGVIARRENDHGPLRWIQDVGFLIGSFFLSIFPMWRPEAPPAQVVEEHNNNGHDQPHAADQPANNNNNEDEFGLPNVRPPRNALEAEEEDDDDDNEHPLERHEG